MMNKVTGERLDELIYWLDKKYSRYHEDEDREAADALREFALVRSPTLREGVDDLREFTRTLPPPVMADDWASPDDPCGQAMRPHMVVRMREFTAPASVAENFECAISDLARLKDVLERLRDSLATP